ncbi:hypothetical protein AB434_2262 [Heyndrickxia coagulans]|uniref:Uncharacterized protein n=1 Tax=Heyndrickxia coagulans TaxID=1398 RepID=A0AAN0WD56_HEYCO|nr:hypothetical protein SB48_HM08orf04882 [Heyndrickxia coagulans]AKN54667.1 hypothetical protein AB434_2262 [Heyndrickxia coagulans]
MLIFVHFCTRDFTVYNLAKNTHFDQPFHFFDFIITDEKAKEKETGRKSAFPPRSAGFFN